MIVEQVLGRSLFALGSPFSLAIKSEALFHLQGKSILEVIIRTYCTYFTEVSF